MGVKMKKILFLICISLFGCAVDPAEQARQQEAEARMTPIQKCFRDADRSSGWCGIGCSGDLLSGVQAYVERGRQCQARCTHTKLMEYEGCKSRYQ